MRALALALLLAGLLAATAADEEALLLAFKASVENWPAVAASRGLVGWAPCAAGSCKPLCVWTGVTCNPFVSGDGGRVTALELPCDNCTVPAMGRLEPSLAGLLYLQTLDLQGNAFYGELPNEWASGFPRLAKLQLRFNNLTGSLPDAWGAGSTFPGLVELHLAGNGFSGTVPDAWALNGASFPNVLVANFANNQLSGSLPETINGLPSLVSLQLNGNDFTGTLPVSWASVPSLEQERPQKNHTLEQLFLHGNRLTGPLPPGWGASPVFKGLQALTLGEQELNGSLPPAWGCPDCFPTLRVLNISHTRLSGTLPDAWGQGFRGLKTLVLDGNQLSSTVPASWAALPALQTVYIQPGNPALCTQLPKGTAFQLCSWDDPFCHDPLQPSNSSACGGADSGAGVPVAAIVAPIVAAVALAAAAAGFLVYRRRQRQVQLQQEWKARSAHSVGAGAAQAFPPAESAFYAKADKGWGDEEAGGQERPKPIPGRGVLGDSAGLDNAASSDLKAQSSSGTTVFGQGAPGSPGCCPAAACLPFLGRATSGSEANPGSGPNSQQQHHSTGSARSGPHSGGSNPPSGGSAVRRGALSAAGSQENFAAWARQQSARGSALGDSSGGGAGEVAAVRLSNCSRDELGWGGRMAVRPSFDTGRGPSFEGCRELEAFINDWEIKPEEIEIMQRPDGSPWELGHGGFGRVYKALRNGVQQVAVKVLNVSAGELHSAKERDFEREIALLRACRSPDIVQFQGVVLQPDDSAALVTEYMEGGNLLGNIRQGKVNWYRRGKRIAVEVARGLAFLHSKRIIHFDVKSANVLLTREGNAKISDVGMSKICLDTGVTGTVGTLAWTAPEVLWGQKCTGKADIYGFGIVLWEIVSGEQPVRGQLRDVLVPEECPDEVRDIILACLEPDPAARPTAAQLVELLQAAPAVPPARTAPSGVSAGSTEGGMPTTVSSFHMSSLAAPSAPHCNQGGGAGTTGGSSGGSSGAAPAQQRQRTSEQEKMLEEAVSAALAGLQGRVAELEAATAAAQSRVAELEQAALRHQAPATPQPAQQAQQQPPQQEAEAAAAAMGRAESLSFASPFAAMQQQGSFSVPASEPGSPVQQLPPPQRAQQPQQPQRATSLLPVQQDVRPPVAGAVGVARAGSTRPPRAGTPATSPSPPPGSGRAEEPTVAKSQGSEEDKMLREAVAAALAGFQGRVAELEVAAAAAQNRVDELEEAAAHTEGQHTQPTQQARQQQAQQEAAAAAAAMGRAESLSFTSPFAAMQQLSSFSRSSSEPGSPVQA